jgi:hypothetical protein
MHSISRSFFFLKKVNTRYIFLSKFCKKKLNFNLFFVHHTSQLRPAIIFTMSVSQLSRQSRVEEVGDAQISESVLQEQEEGKRDTEADVDCDNKEEEEAADALAADCVGENEENKIGESEDRSEKKAEYATLKQKEKRKSQPNDSNLTEFAHIVDGVQLKRRNVIDEQGRQCGNIYITGYLKDFSTLHKNKKKSPPNFKSTTLFKAYLRKHIEHPATPEDRETYETLNKGCREDEKGLYGSVTLLMYAAAYTRPALEDLFNREGWKKASEWLKNVDVKAHEARVKAAANASKASVSTAQSVKSTPVVPSGSTNSLDIYNPKSDNKHALVVGHSTSSCSSCLVPHQPENQALTRTNNRELQIFETKPSVESVKQFGGVADYLAIMNTYVAMKTLECRMFESETARHVSNNSRDVKLATLQREDTEMEIKKTEVENKKITDADANFLAVNKQRYDREDADHRKKLETNQQEHDLYVEVKRLEMEMSSFNDKLTASQNARENRKRSKPVSSLANPSIKSKIARNA